MPAVNSVYLNTQVKKANQKDYTISDEKQSIQNESIFHLNSTTLSCEEVTMDDLVSDDEIEEYKLKKGKSTRNDGVITATKQGRTGDCHFLAVIDAMSYSTKGNDFIQQCLKYDDENRKVTVELKGAGKYEVSYDEMDKARKQQNLNWYRTQPYSTGDDDMLAFELAYEKMCHEITVEQKYYFDNNNLLPYIFTSADDGGTPVGSSYILTGKMSEDVADKAKELDNLDLKNCFYVLGTKQKINSKIEDANGKKVTIYQAHAYALKGIDEKGNIIIVDTHNSEKSITISKKTFLEVIDTMSKCDLTNSNPTVNLKKEYQIDENGNKYCDIKNTGINRCSDIFSNPVDVDYTRTVLDSDGVKEVITVNQKGETVARLLYGKDNNGINRQKERIDYFNLKNGLVTTNVSYSYYTSSGEPRTFCYVNTFDKDGKHLQEEYFKDDAFKNLGSRKLLDLLGRFNLSQINQLAQLIDNDWKNASKYMQENKNATMDEIIDYVNKNRNYWDALSLAIANGRK